MANPITPSLRASLERLKHAGSVNGLCLSWRRQILVSLMPYEDFRVEQLVQVLNDGRDHFQSGGTRLVDSLWLGFPDVHALVVFAGDISVVLLHTRQEEADFLTGVVKTFLNDAQLLVAAALSPSNGETVGGDDEENWLPQPPRLDPNLTNVVS
ncbi:MULTISPECIES: hypothetical protein [unclassified Verrucomicrobium]|jgi:hypothetical protein|uniref:hypothetical protein n=1 Tax=unclassified Verrucomicrobium TaxID=2625155 RepID=UPI00056DA29A|nr:MULTISPECIES: hypothetical protein [unclassified Verrucomicrobium]